MISVCVISAITLSFGLGLFFGNFWSGSKRTTQLSENNKTDDNVSEDILNSDDNVSEEILNSENNVSARTLDSESNISSLDYDLLDVFEKPQETQGSYDNGLFLNIDSIFALDTIHEQIDTFIFIMPFVTQMSVVTRQKLIDWHSTISSLALEGEYPGYLEILFNTFSNF